MKHVKIKDVAKELNLSVATIARAFHEKYDIKKETKELILAKAKELGYHPNPIAKKLILQKTGNVGVVVPEFLNSFFPEVIIGIQEVLIKEGYQVLIMQSGESSEMELDNVKTLENNMVDGIILSLSKESNNIGYYNELISKGMPIVQFNRVNDNLACPKVIFDDFKWSFFATEHLIKQGYKKIYHLSGYKNMTISKQRILGYTKALQKHNIPISPNYIIEAGFFIDDGFRSVENLIKKGEIPEAIFCVNDPVAIGAMKALKLNNFNIPSDVALVGFSESKMVEVVDPPLTSVVQPTHEMGMKSAKLILELINGKNLHDPAIEMLEGKLNIRASSIKTIKKEAGVL